jgi:hypothetical protein
MFKTSKLFPIRLGDLGPVAEAVINHFEHQEYEVDARRTLSGGYDISISKGGVFKAVLGLKTALKVHIESVGNSTTAEARVGIFGQQAIPTAISMLLFWPVLLTQIWGIVQQSKLDEQALGVVESALSGSSVQVAATAQPGVADGVGPRFCPACGVLLSGTPSFCHGCGVKL